MNPLRVSRPVDAGLTADRTEARGLRPGDVIQILGGVEAVVDRVRPYRLVTVVHTTSGFTYRFDPSDVLDRMAS